MRLYLKALVELAMKGKCATRQEKEQLEDDLDVLTTSKKISVVRYGTHVALTKEQTIFMRKALPDFVRFSVPKLDQVLFVYDLSLEDEFELVVNEQYSSFFLGSNPFFKVSR